MPWRRSSSRGGRGNDTIDGAFNSYVLADYATFPNTGIVANLASGQVQDGQGGIDQLLNQAGIRGSSANDTILAPAAGSTSRFVDGGGGADVVDYSGLAATGVGTPSITTSFALSGPAGANVLSVTRFSGLSITDTLLNVERVIGSSGNDSMSGTSSILSPLALTGGAGNDTINGFNNLWNAADYRTSPGGVVMDIGLGTAQDGFGGNDSLTGIVFAYGSDNSDTLRGTSGNETFSPGLGSDSIDGGAGSNSLDYARFSNSTDFRLNVVFTSNSTGTVVQTLNGLVVGTDIAIFNTAKSATVLTLNLDGSWSAVGADGTDALRNIEVARFNDGDVILGGISVEGTSGNDIIRSGFASSGVVGTVNDLGQTIHGGNGDNDQLQGGAGNDTFAANGGQDRVSYSGNGQGGTGGSTGVTVNLATGTATNTAGGHDVLQGIRDVQGSAGNDVLLGTDVLSGVAGIAGYPSGGTQFFGSDGADSIDGIMPLASVTLNYGTFTGSINASFTDFSHASIGKSTGFTDSAANVQSIFGTAGNDSMSGLTAQPGLGTYASARQFQGGAGNDTIDGHGLPVNRPRYGSATSAVNINLETGVAQDGQGGTDLLVNVVNIRASNFNDTIIGSHNDDTIQASLLGSHSLDGAEGNNTFSYFLTNAEDVLIDLGSVAAVGGGWQGFTLKANAISDTLLRFTAAIAADGNDTLLGTPDDDTLHGGGGSNLLDGRGGQNWLSYGTSFYNFLPSHGATVNLTTGLATNPWDGTDTLLHLQSVIGTPYGDSLMGVDPADGSFGFLQGRNGNDTLAAPHAGSHVIADYSRDEAGVTVNLGAGTATDGFGGHDMLIDLNAVRGSAFADSLTGSAGDDSFAGHGGDDSIDGDAGSDAVLLTQFVSTQAGLTHNADGSWSVVTPQGTLRLVAMESLVFSDTTLGLGASISLAGSGGLTNQARQVLTGTTDPGFAGTRVSILDGGVLLTSPLVAADGSFTATIRLASQGAHSVVATHPDPQGGTITSTAVEFLLDSVAPLVAIASPGGLTNQATQTLSGTGEAGTTVTLLEDATVLGSAVVNEAGLWSLGITMGSAQGLHSIIALDTDAAGNAGTSRAVAFTLDTLAPLVALTVPGGLTNRATQSISGTGEVGSMVEVLDGAAVEGSIRIGSTGTWARLVTLAGQGDHLLTARATDSAGNAARTAPLLFQLDSVAPAVAISGAGGLTNQRAQALSGTGEAGTTVVVKDGRTLLGSTTVDGDGLWSLAVTLSTAQGAHALVATGTDAAGNAGTSAPVTYTLDTLAPAVTVGTAGGLTNQRLQTLGGTGEVGASVQLLEGSTLLGSATVDGAGLWSATVLLPNAEGSHSLVVRATDTAGNTGQASGSVAYMLDTVAPVLTIANAGGPSNKAALTLSGTGEAGATVVLADGATALGTALVGSNGKWAKAVTLASQGAHAITAQEADAAGNASNASVTLDLDTVAPTPGITGLASSTIQPAQLVAGVGEAGSQISLYDNTVLVGSTTVDAGGQWSLATTLASAGRHNLFARAVDAAGNVANSATASTTLLVADAGGQLAMPLGISIADADFAGLSGLKMLNFNGTGASSVVLGATAATALAASATLVAAAGSAGLAVDASGLGAATALVLRGAAGADNLVGGDANDYLRGGGGADTLLGGGGNDTFDFGTLAAFTATGLVVDGGSGQNRVNLGFTGTLDDSAFASLSHVHSLFLYGSGAETLNFDSNAATAFGAKVGVQAAASITSLVANGVALGSGTAMTVQGSAGADRLTGGAGNDSFSGGAGADIFDLSVGGQDAISDLNVAQDVIRLAGLGLANFAALSGKISYALGNAVINIDPAHQVTLTGVAPGSLVASDFLFM